MKVNLALMIVNFDNISILFRTFALEIKKQVQTMEKKIYVVTAAVFSYSDDELWTHCIGVYNTLEEAEIVVTDNKADDEEEGCESEVKAYDIAERIVNVG